MARDNVPFSRRRFLAAGGAAVCGSALFARSVPAADEPDSSNGAPQDALTDRPSQLLDCHLHINHFQRSVEETIRHMDLTGTDKAFVLPLETGEGGVTLPTETVLHAWKKVPDRIIPFCQTDVRQPDLMARIHAYHLLGCRGVGEQKEHLPLNDKRIEGLIALCDELDWPVTFHFQDGADGYNQGLAEHLETYLKRYKKVRIIGHAQTWWANISADVPPAEKTMYPKGPVQPGGLLDRLLSEYPNLYADLSAGSGYNALSRDEEFTAGFIERHPRQLLFGSDCPCRTGKGGNGVDVCYSMRLQEFLRKMINDEETLQDIFCHNAMRALNGAG